MTPVDLPQLARPCRGVALVAVVVVLISCVIHNDQIVLLDIYIYI